MVQNKVRRNTVNEAEASQKKASRLIMNEGFSTSQAWTRRIGQRPLPPAHHCHVILCHPSCPCLITTQDEDGSWNAYSSFLFCNIVSAGSFHRRWATEQPKKGNNPRETLLLRLLLLDREADLPEPLDAGLDDVTGAHGPDAAGRPGEQQVAGLEGEADAGRLQQLLDGEQHV